MAGADDEMAEWREEEAEWDEWAAGVKADADADAQCIGCTGCVVRIVRIVRIIGRSHLFELSAARPIPTAIPTALLSCRPAFPRAPVTRRRLEYCGVRDPIYALIPANFSFRKLEANYWVGSGGRFALAISQQLADRSTH